MGYDKPRGLGHGATGGGLAAPIFKDFMRVALDGTPNVDFKVPDGMKLIAINRKTGMRATTGDPGTIIEAFKPGTGPADSYWVIGMGADGSNAAGGRAVAAGQPGHPGRRRRPLLTGRRCRPHGLACRRRPISLYTTAAPSLCIAPTEASLQQQDKIARPCARKRRILSTKSSRR